ncbi:MAG: hypothetical protein JNK60_09530 [Acidobacteria bacterium]|nr:hypothetical protein [Acidobacteriota bacterium]
MNRICGLLLLLATTVQGLEVEGPPTRLEAMLKTLQNNPRHAEVAPRVREAIAEARALKSDAALRDALLVGARTLMAKDGLVAGLDLLREEAWPASPADRCLLHALMADALLEHARNPSSSFSSPAQPGTARERWEAQLAALARRRREEGLKHLDAAWRLRAELPDDPVAAFGSFSYWLSAGRGMPPPVEFAREVVTLLLARALAKRESLTVAESLVTVPAATLIEPGAAESSSGLHPLHRAAMLLKDLEAWHVSRGRRDAALKAARSAFQILESAAMHTEKDALLQAFEARLRRDRDLDGFAGGLSELGRALMNRGYGTPAGRARARAVLKECVAALPASPAAEDCAGVLSGGSEVLELSGMLHDAPGRRSLALRTRGLEAVHFFAFLVDIEKDLPLLLPEMSSQQPALTFLKSTEPAASWTVNPERPMDDEPHITWVSPPVKKGGAYLIVASASPDTNARENLLVAAPFLPTDLVVLTRPTWNGGLEVVVVDGDTGTVQQGVRVRQFSYPFTDGKPLFSAVTPASGRVVLPPGRGRPGILVASRGETLAIVPASPFDTGDREAPGAFVTDRSRYRPGESLRFYVLGTRRPPAGDGYQPFASQKIAVTLQDPAGRPRRRLQPTTNRFGSASGTLTVPSDAQTGTWSIGVTRAGADPERRESYLVFAQIEVSGGADVNLSLDEPAAAVPGEPLRVTGRFTGSDARLTHGGTVSCSLKVAGGVADRGSATVTAEGVFELSLAVPAGAGEHLEVQASLPLGRDRLTASRFVKSRDGAIYVRLPDTYRALRPGERFTAEVTRASGSDPVPGESRYRVERLNVPKPGTPVEETLLPPGEGLLESDRMRSRLSPAASSVLWKEDDREESREVVEGVLTHGEDGTARIETPPLEPGLYRVRVESVDRKGAPIADTLRFIVLTKNERLPFAASNQLLLMQDSAKKGEPWRVLVHCSDPGPGSQVCLLDYHNGGRLSRQTVRGTRVLSFPFGSPGISELHLTTVRDFRLVQNSTLWSISGGERALDPSARAVSEGRLELRLPPGSLAPKEAAEVLVTVAPEPAVVE